MLKKIDNFIGNFENDYPYVYKVMYFLFLKRGLAGKLINLAGVILSPSILVILVYFVEGKKVIEAIKASQDSPYTIIFAILLVLLAICIYWTDNSTNKMQEVPLQNNDNGNYSNGYRIIRIVDKKIAARLPLICTFLVLLLLSILLSILVIVLAYPAPKFNMPIALVLLLLRVCFIIFFLCGPIFILALLRNLFLIQKNKMIFLPARNLFIEYSKDGYLYLTRYRFLCEKCKTTETMTLNRMDGFKLICNAYKEHNFDIEPATFTKYSLPNLPSENNHAQTNRP